MTADHFAHLDQFGADLWKLADQLRANSGLASNEYFMPILGLLFLRHATNRYYAAREAIAADQAGGSMPKRPLRDADFTQRRAMNLPEAARYDVILNQHKDGSLGHPDGKQQRGNHRANRRRRHPRQWPHQKSPPLRSPLHFGQPRNRLPHRVGIFCTTSRESHECRRPERETFMTTHPFVEPRARLIEWVRHQLVGASRARGSEGSDLRGVLPTERFPCGAIYPVSSSGEGIDPAGDEVEDAEAAAGASGESNAEPAIVRRYIPPSSLGFSFFIKGGRIELQLLCSAVRYERTERDERGRYKNEWTRKVLVSEADSEEVVNVTCPDKEQHQSHGVLADRARLDTIWRPFADGWIVTVTLCNTQVVADDTREFAFERAEKTLFEANLRCVIDAGHVSEYPRVDRSLLDDE